MSEFMEMRDLVRVMAQGRARNDKGKRARNPNSVYFCRLLVRQLKGKFLPNRIKPYQMV